MFEERVRIEYSTDLLNFKINNIVIGNEDELNNTPLHYLASNLSVLIFKIIFEFKIFLF